MPQLIAIRRCVANLAITLVGVTAVVAWVMAADPEPRRGPAAAERQHGTRFQFEVVESFDAKYAGDSPGHIGRGGGLFGRPEVAIGDAVYHVAPDSPQAIGVVTGATWDRLRGSLTVEFRPTRDSRIAVGDQVWLEMNTSVAEGNSGHAPTDHAPVEPAPAAR
ncbi:MAG: hypothetical protein WCC69_10490 [Pirellulales bacterium]